MPKINKKAFETANQKGIFKEFQFFLCLKPISTPGYIPAGQYLKIIQDRIKEYNSHNPYRKLPSSQSQISRLVNKCRDLGFLRRNKTGIYLNSYKKVFALLEASHKSQNYDNNTFVEDFCIRTLDQKLKAIRRAIKKAHPWQRAVGELETFFSCASISKLFGFNTRTQGYNLRKYFEKLGLIHVKTSSMKFLGVNKVNRHFPGSFKFDDKYFYKPSSSIKITICI